MKIQLVFILVLVVLLHAVSCGKGNKGKNKKQQHHQQRQHQSTHQHEQHQQNQQQGRNKDTQWNKEQRNHHQQQVPKPEQKTEDAGDATAAAIVSSTSEQRLQQEESRNAAEPRMKKKSSSDSGHAASSSKVDKLSSDPPGRLWYALSKYYRSEVAPYVVAAGGAAESAESAAESVESAAESVESAASAESANSDSCVQVDGATSAQQQPRVPIQVEVSIRTEVITFLSREELLEVSYYISLKYTDPRLTWEPLQYSNIQRISVPASKLWIPDIKVINRVLKGNAGCMSDELRAAIKSYTANVNHTGEVTLVVPAASTVYCHFDSVADGEVCELSFVSWSHDTETLEMRLPESEEEDCPLPARAHQQSGDESGDEVWVPSWCSRQVWAVSPHPVSAASGAYTQLTYTYGLSLTTDRQIQQDPPAGVDDILQDIIDNE